MRKRDYKAEWKKRSLASKLRNWYKSSDKKLGRQNDLTTKDVKEIIEKPCYYCDTTPSNGIDRISNEFGHLKSNCVASCYKCNMLLSTLPFDGKILLIEGLRRIRERGIFDNWEPPPMNV